MMMTYIIMIGGFFASDTKEVLHLPLFQDCQRWYLNVDTLVGKKGARSR
jgi:hypothetical protein